VPLVSYPWIWLLGEDSDKLEERARLLADRADGFAAGLLLVVIVGIGAPIFEEIFYRGLVLQALRKRGLGPAVAIGITAAVFAGIHLSMVELPALFVFALGAGYLAHRYDRLGPAIVAHMAFNLVTTANILVMR
jgi:membrane protease YdiL (CAAX protease family)